MNFIYKTETDTQTQVTNLWLPMGKAQMDKLGAGDQQIQSTMYKINKQDSTIQHRKLYSSFCNNYNGKEYGKEHMYI